MESEELGISREAKAPSPLAGEGWGEGTRFWQYLDQLLASHALVIDRPKGTAHPRHPSLVYPLDYGYLEGTVGGDGNEVDVWVGSLPDKALNAIVCTVDLMKNDVEVKLLLGCSKEDVRLILDVHNWDKMSAMVIERPK